MRRQFLLSALLYPISALSRSVMVPLLQGEPLTLTTPEASELFRQCSRAAPVPDQVLGAPPKEEVEQLEQRLERFVAEEYEAGRRAPAGGLRYARQYAAFLRNGTRLVYGSYFPADLLHRSPPGKAVVVCDGGAAFWGVVYNPSSRRLSELNVNGPA